MVAAVEFGAGDPHRARDSEVSDEATVDHDGVFVRVSVAGVAVLVDAVDTQNMRMVGTSTNPMNAPRGPYIRWWPA